MTFDLEKILESKRVLRRQLAARLRARRSVAAQLGEGDLADCIVATKALRKNWLP
jgi:hypothetical protein